MTAQRNTRRDFLISTATAATALTCSACGEVRPTPQCGEQTLLMPTRSDILGPYYKAGAPADAALAEPGDPGVRLTLSGQTMDTCLRPISGALLDIWQADDAGAYDATGFHLRGVLS